MATEHLPNAIVEPFAPALPSSARSNIKLRNGDRMSREEFHRLYEQTPEDFKAELIGGIVYVASPVSLSHGKPHLLLGSVFAAYEARTPGTDASDNTTVMLGDEGEPQPDLFMRILPEFGGQSSTTDNGCVKGPPEFVAEIAYSSRAIDLHGKKDDYSRYGVREYLVDCVEDEPLRWFDLAAGKELQPDAAGNYRIKTFPGLWINGPALFSHDYASLMKTLEEGLSSPEHAAFVEDLARRRSTT
jgi:Uma2 family endonuclease